MIQVGGFAWLGLVVPVVILIAGGSLGDRIQRSDRSRKAGHIQLELARANLGAMEHAPGLENAREARGVRPASASSAPTAAARPTAGRPRLLEEGDPRTRSEIVAVLDRLLTNVLGSVPESELATLRRIRDLAALALPANDEPLELTDHDTWLLRQICIDYVPRALDHYLALPPDLASEPLLDGRSAQQVLDGQLTLIENRLADLATRSYRREAGGLLTHARFLADSLRPDPFQAQLAELATSEAQPVSVAPEPVDAREASVSMGTTAIRERKRA
jgi:hypothetical protein